MESREEEGEGGRRREEFVIVGGQTRNELALSMSVAGPSQLKYREERWNGLDRWDRMIPCYSLRGFFFYREERWR